ncbi:MAG: MmgE/PrpD family protein [Hyphomicrobiaceae bacterium]
MTNAAPLELGDLVAASRFEDLPADVVVQVRRHVLDTLGAGLAGATSEEARRTRDALLATDGAGASVVWGTALKLSPRNAALVNGTAAHAFELDDTGGCDHSGAVVLPAALAALDVTTREVSGAEFLHAVVLGYDVARRVLEGFGGYAAHNEPGWHSTGTCGTFGAAAAAARILGLDGRRSAAAISTAASFSSGLWAFIHDGAMTKRLHAGRAAEGGLLAAQLAAAGLTGPMRVFDDVWGGFFKTLGDRPPTPEALLRDLGSDWRIRIAAIKPYASCRDTHPAVDAVRRILTRHSISADDIAGVRVRVNEFLHAMVGSSACATLPAAQMSLPYAIAAAIVFRDNGLSAYTPARRGDPRLRSMIERVDMVIDPAVASSASSSIVVELRDGSRIEEATSVPLGAPENPVSDAELVEKFDGLARLVLSRDTAGRLAAAVLSLDRAANVRILPAMLRGDGPRSGT